MPTISIYLNNEIYKHLTNKGEKSPSAVGKQWIEERYNKEIKV